MVIWHLPPHSHTLQKSVRVYTDIGGEESSSRHHDSFNFVQLPRSLYVVSIVSYNSRPAYLGLTTSILLIGSETRTLLQEDIRKLEVFHMRSQRMIKFGMILAVPRDKLA